MLLSIAEAGDADYLVSGDKRHVRSLKHQGKTRIVSVRTMLEVLETQEQPMRASGLARARLN